MFRLQGSGGRSRRCCGLGAVRDVDLKALGIGVAVVAVVVACSLVLHDDDDCWWLLGGFRLLLGLVLLGGSDGGSGGLLLLLVALGFSLDLRSELLLVLAKLSLVHLEPELVLHGLGLLKVLLLGHLGHKLRLDVALWRGDEPMMKKKNMRCVRVHG